MHLRRRPRRVPGSGSQAGEWLFPRTTPAILGPSPTGKSSSPESLQEPVKSQRVGRMPAYPHLLRNLTLGAGTVRS